MATENFYDTIDGALTLEQRARSGGVRDLPDAHGEAQRGAQDHDEGGARGANDRRVLPGAGAAVVRPGLHADAFAAGQPMQPPDDIKSVAAKAQWVKAAQAAAQSKGKATGAPDDESGGPTPPPPPPNGGGLADRARQSASDQLDVLQQQEQGEPIVPQTAPPDGAAMLAAQQEQQARQAAISQAANRAIETPDDEIYQSVGIDNRAPSARMSARLAALGLTYTIANLGSRQPNTLQNSGKLKRPGWPTVAPIRVAAVWRAS